MVSGTEEALMKKSKDVEGEWAVIRNEVFCGQGCCSWDSILGSSIRVCRAPNPQEKSNQKFSSAMSWGGERDTIREGWWAVCSESAENLGLDMKTSRSLRWTFGLS